MIKRNHYGFTLVELTVVIAVIGILASVGIVSYIEVQKQSRDNQRQTDMTIFQNELEKFYEKNGTYPPGCPDTTCSSWFMTENTSSAVLNPGTSLATLQSVLPGIPATFGDPRAGSNATPLMNQGLSTVEYIYYGGAIDSRSTGSSTTSGPSTYFPCGLHIALNAGDSSSYVIGYYSESTGKWVLTGGKHGVPITISAGTSDQGCVINS